MIKVSHILNSVFSSMTYILSCDGSNDVWLVDCGDVDKLPNDIVVKGALLTHAHFDHIYGIPKLLEMYPNCVIYTNIIGKETLADPKANMSKYHDSPLSIKPNNVRICADGDVIEIFKDTIAMVYETPGHHPSCLTFAVDNFVFTGDAYIPGFKVVTNLPRGDRSMAQKSTEKILVLSQGKAIYSGHGL